MSKAKFDSDGFQIVSSKRFSRNKPTKIPFKDFKLQQEESVINYEQTILKIKSAVKDLRGSNYFKKVSESVSTVIQTRKVTEIVCFGLGHFGECNISRYQLGLLLCLEDLYSPEKLSVHDPVFYKSECDILKQLRLNVIEENTEGGYITPEENTTIIYLPHCPKQLTNNFLWSNWGVKLKNCVLICNSFSSLIENQPTRILQEDCPFILKIFPYTSEIQLKNNFKYTDIFNDTSIHHFPEEILCNLEAEFWNKGEKPKYNCEEFITSLMVEKLNS